MLLLDKDFKKDMRERNVSIQELADYLVRNNTVYDLATELAERIIKDKNTTTAKIVVSHEEYEAITSLFRIRGFNEDGTESKRGRPKKD